MSFLKKRRTLESYNGEKDVIQQGGAFLQDEIQYALNYHQQEELDRIEEDEAIAILLQRQENEWGPLNKGIKRPFKEEEDEEEEENYRVPDKDHQRLSPSVHALPLSLSEEEAHQRSKKEHSGGKEEGEVQCVDCRRSSSPRYNASEYACKTCEEMASCVYCMNSCTECVECMECARVNEDCVDCCVDCGNQGH